MRRPWVKQAIHSIANVATAVVRRLWWQTRRWWIKADRETKVQPPQAPPSFAWLPFIALLYFGARALEDYRTALAFPSWLPFAVDLLVGIALVSVSLDLYRYERYRDAASQPRIVVRNATIRGDSVRFEVSNSGFKDTAIRQCVLVMDSPDFGRLRHAATMHDASAAGADVVGQTLGALRSVITYPEVRSGSARVLAVRVDKLQLPPVAGILDLEVEPVLGQPVAVQIYPIPRTDARVPG